MFKLKGKLPDIVIRRSGIWNSRAPFHNYILGNREIQRSYNVLTLAVYQLQFDAAQEEPTRHARNFLKEITRGGGPTVAPAIALKAWQGYKLSFGRDSEGKPKRPSVENLSNNLGDALYDVREGAIVKLASFFESFAQCWALNYLLTRLENGRGWTPDERTLAEGFSPVHGKINAPGWPTISQRIPNLQSGLTKLPHINKDPTTDSDVTMPISPDLNAFRTIKFWRDFRNNVVHSSGLVTSTFRDEHAAFFEQLRKPYSGHMGPLQLGKSLQFFDTVFRAMATTHYKAALWMNTWLETESQERRGHPHAPSSKPLEYFDSTGIVAPPLLVPGDHAESLRWAVDSSYRAQFL